MTIILRPAARSDRGLIRDGNQDSFYAGPRLLAVADGMGGMAAGDVASNIVIEAVAPLDEDVPPDNIIDAVRHAVEIANQRLRDTVVANPAIDGMGTTLTAMLFAGHKLGMVHIGDSRAYMLRDGEFGQITKDDTYVQMLVDQGRITLEEASVHPQRSLITQALNGQDIDPDYSVRQVLAGDRYLICSDGLSAVVSAETIGQTLREYVDPQQCVERLVALALRGGGPDNITVIVADATDEDIVEQAPVVGGAAARDGGEITGTLTESTPAQRASALTAPRAAAPESPLASTATEETARKRHPVRTALVMLAVLALLGVGAYFTWDYTQSRYYVGVTESGQIAVFQGVPGQIAGLDLSEVRLVSDTRLTELTDQAQERVRKGIQADSEADARSRLDELVRDDPANVNLLPSCPIEFTPSPSVSVSASAPATLPAPTPSDSPNESVVPSPVPCRSN